MSASCANPYPIRARVMGWHSDVEALLGPPPPQMSGDVQVPQLETVREVPQLSLAVTCPQVLPSRLQNVVFDSAIQVAVEQVY